MLDPATFDPAQPLVMGRFNTVNGFAITPGDPISITEDPKAPGEVTVDSAVRLWSGGTFIYAKDARPTPVESPQDAARRLARMEDLGGGWYLITAPWMGEGEKLQGQEAAQTRFEEVIEAGQPADFDPATAAANAAAGGASETTEGAGSGESGDKQPTVQERIDALVAANDLKALQQMVTDINAARAANEPPLPALEPTSNATKPALAALIVGVDGDIGPGTNAPAAPQG